MPDLTRPLLDGCVPKHPDLLVSDVVDIVATNALMRAAAHEIGRLSEVIAETDASRTRGALAARERLRRSEARRAAQIVHTKRWKADAKSLRMVLRILLGEKFENDVDITYGWQRYDERNGAWVDCPSSGFSHEMEYMKRFPVYVRPGVQRRFVRRTAVTEEI